MKYNPAGPSLMQQLFDHVCTHLMTQRKKAITPHQFHGIDQCQYRAKDGCKCAIGCLINDKHYRPELEGPGVQDPSVRKAVEKSIDTLLDSSHIGLLGQLQHIHDSQPVKEWEFRLRLLAAVFKLTIPECIK